MRNFLLLRRRNGSIENGIIFAYFEVRMKKRFLRSALCLALSVIMAFSLISPAASALSRIGAGDLVVLNNGSLPAASYNASAPAVSPLGEGVGYKTTIGGDKADAESEWWFALEPPVSISDAEGFAFYVNLSEVTSPVRFKVTVGKAGSMSRAAVLAMTDAVRAEGQHDNVIRISENGDTETVSQIGAYGEDLGFNLPAGFCGYVVLKAFGKIPADADAMHITRSADTSLEDASAEIWFDDICAVFDIDEFVSGGYKALAESDKPAIQASLNKNYTSAAEKADSLLLNSGTSLDKVHGDAVYSLNTSRLASAEANGYNMTYVKGDLSAFDITRSGKYTAEAYAFYVNTVELVDGIGFNTALADNLGDELSKIAFSNTYYLLSEGGEVTTAAAAKDYDIYIPACFVGYVVLPVNISGENFSFSSVCELQLETATAPTDAEAAAQICIDNIQAVSNLESIKKGGANLLGAVAYSGEYFRPAIYIPKSADTLTVRFSPYDSATSYIVALYELVDGIIYNGSYAYNCSVSVTDTTASFADLTAGKGYAVQISAYDGEDIIATSELKEFTAEERDNYTLIHNGNTLTSTYTTFPDAKVVESEHFADGKGIMISTARKQQFAYELGAKVDLGQYETASVFMGAPSDTANPVTTQYTFYNCVDENGVTLTDFRAAKANTNCSYLNPAKATLLTRGVSENGIHVVKLNEYNYCLMALNTFDEKVLSNAFHIVSSYWHGNANNIDRDFYLDSFALIDNYDIYIEDLAAATAEAGMYTGGSEKINANSSAYTASGEKVKFSWAADSNASSYDINIYRQIGDNYEYIATQKTATAAAEVLLEYGYNYAVQVVAFTAKGAVSKVFAPKYSNTAAISPEILGASFNAANSLRFAAFAPQKVLDGMTVAGYGIVMLPEDMLDGELKIDTEKAVCANVAATPALSSEYYAVLTSDAFDADERIAARAYITYKSGNDTITVYSADTIVRSMNEVALSMADAVLLYSDSKAGVVKYNSTVTKTTTRDKLASLDIKGIRSFLLDNTDAVEVAYNRVLLDSANDSRFNERAEFAYFYENDRYAYGITKDYREVISVRTEDGNVDVLEGAGQYNILGINDDATKETVYKNAGVLFFEQSVIDGYTALTVTYKTTGAVDPEANMSTTYIFAENAIRIKADVKYANKNVTLSKDDSYLYRNILQPYDVDYHWVTDWIYPENGDYPYKMTNSWAHEYKVSDTVYMHSFLRGENCPVELGWQILSFLLPERNYNVYFENSTSIDYYTEYDLVLSDTYKTDNDLNEKALFDGLDSDYSVRIIAPDAKDNVSVFTGDEMNFDIALRAIKDSGTLATVSYRIYNYNGELVDSVTDTVSLSKGESKIYDVNIKASKSGYGSYFINLTVQSDDYEYTEYYSPALLYDYEYKYYSQSPFGIAQFLSEEHGSFDDKWAIIEKIGLAGSRNMFMNSPYSNSDYIDRCLEFLAKANKKGLFVNYQTTDAREEYLPYIDYIGGGNEINLAVINGDVTMDERFTYYYDTYFAPTKEICNTHGKLHNLGGVSAGQTAWYDKLYSEGLWDSFDAISLHVYSGNTKPEQNPSYVWSVIGGLKRTREALDKYGDKYLILDETGYYTLPNNLNRVSLRNQAEYNTRCYIMGLEYGCDKVMTYCLLDYSNSKFGTCLNDMEHHFGNFYYPDYYGRIIPKPSAAAFGAMTRLLESYEGLTVSDKTTETLKVYNVDTTVYGNVIVAWSNIDPFDAAATIQRTPALTWVETRTESEDLVIKTASSSVKVYDQMGNYKVYTAKNGSVTIPVSGATIYIVGA